MKTLTSIIVTSIALHSIALSDEHIAPLLGKTWGTDQQVKYSFSYIGNINKNRYETKVDGALLHKAGGTVWLQLKNEGKQNSTTAKPLEPKGKITLYEAITLGQKSAKAILKDKLNGARASWVMKSASRESKGGDSIYDYYYRLSYSPRYGAGRPTGEEGNLIVVVLLDGTVISPRKIVNQ